MSVMWAVVNYSKYWDWGEGVHQDGKCYMVWMPGAFSLFTLKGLRQLL